MNEIPKFVADKIIDADDLEIIGAGGGMGKGGASDDDNSLRSNATALVLYLIGEGRIEGIVDGLKNVILDDTHVWADDGTVNIKGVKLASRIGNPVQDPIPAFDGSPTEITVNHIAKFAIPWTATLNNADFKSVIVTIRVPALVKSTDEGLKTWDVEYRIEVRYDGGTYQNLLGDIKLEGKNTAPYDVQYAMKLPQAPSGITSQWDIRLTRLVEDSDDDKKQNDIYFYSMTGLSDVTLQYPDSALMGLILDATEFDGSIPTVSAIVDGLWISVPSNYNAATRVYTGTWDGTFNKQYCKNAAWVYWDIATNDRYGLGKLLDKKYVDKYTLYTISKICNDMVPDGYGGTEPRFEINAYITKAYEAYDLMQMIASAFRGMSYWASGALTASQDVYSDPKILLTRANVIGGDFSYSSSSLASRHTIVQVKYLDAKNDYVPAIEVVRDEDAILRYGERKKEVDGFGLTSRAAAQRLGRWILYTELYECSVVTYQAGLDHAMRRPGDIISIMDEEVSGVDYGGRLLASLSGNRWQVDRPINIAAGKTYRLYLTMPDGSIVDKAITNTVGSTDILSVGTLWPMTPASGAVYIVTSNTVSPKPYRIVSILERAKTTFEVTALEVYAPKYALTDSAVTLDDPPYRQETRPAAPTNLTAKEVLRYNNGKPTTQILLSWTQDRAQLYPKFRLEVDTNDSKKDIVIRSFEGMSYLLEDTQGGEYTFRVAALGAGGHYRSDPASLTFTAQGALLANKVSVTDVDIQGEGGQQFFDRNFSLRWRNTVPETTGAHHLVYQRNKIEVYNNDVPASPVLLDTYYSTVPRFKYTYKMNRLDNGGSATRNLQFRIQAQDTKDRWGPITTFNAYNAAPDAPVFTLDSNVKTITVDTNFPDTKEILGQRIHIGATAGFTPNSGNMVYEGTAASKVIKVSPGAYYVKVGLYDNFLKSDINYNTTGVLVTTSGVADGDLDPTVPTGVAAAPSITTVTADIDGDGTLDTGLQITFVAPTTGRVPKRYLVEIYRSTSIGTAGSLSGYSLWDDYYTNKVTSRRKANTNYFHKAVVTSVAVNEVLGVPSPSTSVGVKSVVKGNNVPTVTTPTVVARPKGNIVSWTPLTINDLRTYRIWRWVGTASTPASATLIARTDSDKYLDNDSALNVGDTVWYYITAIDLSGNESGTKSTGASVINRAIIDGDTDNTQLVAPTNLLISQDNADLDDDGKVDIALLITWDDMGSAYKKYEVELSQSATSGGTYTVIDNRVTKNLKARFPAKSTKFYKARIKGFSFNGRDGVPSALTAAFQPIKDLIAPEIGAITSVIAKPRMMRVVWTACVAKDYDETLVLRNGTAIGRLTGNTFADTEDLVSGTSYTYTIQHIDKTGNVGTVSPGVPGTYRGTQGLDIDPGTIGDSLVNDAGFESGSIASWAKSGGILTNVVVTDSPSGARALLLDRTATPVSVNIIQTQFIPVDELATYYAEFTIKGETTLGVPGSSAVGAYLRVNFYDATKTQPASGGNGVQYRDYASNAAIPSTWGTLSGAFAIPAGIKYVKIQMYHHVTSTIQLMYIGTVMFRKHLDGKTFKDGSVLDAKNDQTVPGTVAAPTVTKKQTVDGDGTVNTKLKIVWSAPATTVPIRYYEVYINDGTDSHYFKTKNPIAQWPGAQVGLTYTVAISAISFAGIASPFTNSFPLLITAKTNAVTAAGTLVATQKAKGVFLKWPRCSDKDYKETIVLRGGTEIARIKGSAYKDDENLVIGTSYTYTVRHVDNTDNLGTVSNGQTVIWAGLLAGELPANDWSNFIQNNNFVGNISDPWTGTFTLTDSTAGTPVAPLTTAPSRYVLTKLSTSGASDIYSSDFFTVKAGDKFYYEFDYASDSGTTGQLLAQFRVEDAAGTQSPGVVATISTPTTTWLKASGTITIGAGIQRVKFGARTQSGGVGNWYMTNFRLIRVATSEIIADGAVTDAKADQTAPGVVGIPTVTKKQTTDGDGVVNTKLKITWTAPTTTVPIRYYEVRISDGTDITYQKTKNLSCIMSGAQYNLTYTVSVSAISFNGIASAFTNSFPLLITKKSTTMPGGGTLTGTPLKKRIILDWVDVDETANPDYNNTFVYRQLAATPIPQPGTTAPYKKIKAGRFPDDGITSGVTYFYYVAHRDNSGFFGAISSVYTNSSGGDEVSGFSDLTGSITGPQIPSKIIDADKINVGDWGLTPNSNFANGSAVGWIIGPNTIVENSGSDTDGGGRYRLKSGDRDVAYSDYFDIEDGESIYVRAKVYNNNTEDANLYLVTYDDGGLNYIFQLIATTTAKGFWVTLEGNIRANNTNARKARILLQVAKTAGTNLTTYAYFARIKARRSAHEKSTDQTAPTAPSITLSQLAADIDGDGTADIGLNLSIVNPNNTVEIKRYIIEISRSATSGGTYTVWKRETVEAEDVLDTVTTFYSFKANQNKFHKVRVKSVAFSGAKSGYSGLSGAVQPSAKPSFSPIGGVATPVVVAKAKGFYVTWTACTDKDYAYTIVSRFDSTTGTQIVSRTKTNAFTDHSELVINRSYQYSIVHYDNTGNASASSSLAAGVPYRVALYKDLPDNSDTSNLWKNSTFEGGSSDSLSLGSFSILTRFGAAVSGAPAAYVAQVTANGTFLNMANIASTGSLDVFPISPKENLAIRFFVAATTGTAGFSYVQVQYLNASGDGVVGYGSSIPQIANANTIGVWTEVKGIVTAPDTVNGLPTAYVRFYFEVNNGATAGSVCVTKIRVRRATDADMTATGFGSNQIENSDFALGQSNWGVYSSSNTANFTTSMTVGMRMDTYGVGDGSFEVRQINNVASQYLDIAPFDAFGVAKRYPVTGDKWYESSVYFLGHRYTRCELYLQWFDSTGTHITYSLLDSETTPRDLDPAKKLSNYGRMWGKAQAPTNACFCTVFFRVTGTIAAQTDCYVWFYKALFAECNAYQTEPSPWVNGAVSVVTDNVVNQTGTGTPGTPSISSIAADLDGDGTLDANISVSWTAPVSSFTLPQATGYEVEISNSATATGTYVVKDVRVVAGLSLTFKANQNRFYKVRVRGITAFGKTNANWSALSSAQQPINYASAIPAPTWVTPSGTTQPVVVKPKSIQLRWNPVTASVKNYLETIVYRNLTNAAPVAGDEIGRVSGSRFKDDDDLIPGGSYFYFLRHVDAAGGLSAASSGYYAQYRVASAVPSNGDFDTTALAAPSSMSMTQDNQDLNSDGKVDIAFTVAWAAVANAAKYEVQVLRATAVGGTYTAIGSGGITGGALVWSFPANPKYFYKTQVRAINAYGQPGSWVGPQGTGIAPSKKSLSVAAPTSLGIIQNPLCTTYTWTMPTDADYAYTEVWTSIDAGVTWIFRNSIRGREYIDNNAPSAFYTGVRLRIRHVDTSGFATTFFTNSVDYTGLGVDTIDIKALAVTNAKIADNSVYPGKFVPNTLTGIDRLNSNTGVTTTASGVQTLQSITANHGSGPSSVTLIFQFRNASGGPRTVDIELWNTGGLGQLWSIPSVTIPDNGVETIHYCIGGSSLSGTATNFQLRVTPNSIGTYASFKMTALSALR